MRWITRVFPVLFALLPLCALFAARRAQTVPLYAARTGNLCGTRHFDPNGGGPRNDFGFAYARSRHSLAPEDSASEWHDLAVTNRIGDNMPVYLGVNQRFMLIANTTEKSDSLDRFGFFNMENSLHMAFQPHRRLTLVYSRDGFDEGSSTKEAFGMIGGFRWNGYFKAGRFRTPFGLRMDDHTVATRNSFLDFYDQKRFLPYDPRKADMGYEVGGDSGPWFARAAFTNGDTHPLGFVNTNAQAVTAKLGMNRPDYQGAVSFYDDFHREGNPLGGSPVSARRTRWGYYGMTHWQRFALLGEVAAGTDFGYFVNPISFTLYSAKTNSLAGFAELDWSPHRQYNMRFRYDRVELDRSSDADVREDNTHSRYSLEGEWVPVPFAELRWVARRIDHQHPDDKDESQAYVQMHFSY